MMMMMMTLGRVRMWGRKREFWGGGGGRGLFCWPFCGLL
jgi:hypothetical protein